MKATYRGARIGSATHNDRSYPGGSRDGVKLMFLGRPVGPAERLEDLEREYYRSVFTPAQEAKNERYRALRHPERCRTTDDLYKGRRTRPYELVLQVGNANEQPDPDKFKKALAGFLEAFNRKYWKNCQILTAALHEDEATPHVHIRMIFAVKGKDGPVLNQTQALQQMGVPLPNPDKPESRYNCRLKTWTEDCRELWISCCREHGLQVEDSQKCDRNHLSIRDYKAAAATAAREKERIQGFDQDLQR